MPATTGNRLSNLSCDPGTPDCKVSVMRMKGRTANREGDRRTEPKIGQPGRTDWWLGWWDEELKHLYGRA